MRIIGIIPARMASSRFPGKPLAKIHGVPMLGHVFFRSRMAEILDDVYVATCDEEIREYIVSAGGKAVMTSDKHERASDRAKEAMLKVEEMTGKKTDIAVMIQGDEPMLYPEMIDEAVSPLLSDDSVLVSNLTSPLKSRDEQDDPNTVKTVFDNNGDALYFSREPIPSRKKTKGGVVMYKQVAIIPFRRDALIAFNELAPTPLEITESVDMLRLLEHGYKVRMVRTLFETYGVDTPSDLKKVEALMAADALFARYKDAQ
jgi:3-deoxy-manno-octulosonate cytidylyltransferase (CMP-KDO synthetase)